MKKNLTSIAFCFILSSLHAQNSTGGSTVVPGGGIDPTLATPTKRTSVVPPATVKEKFEKKHAGSNNVVWKLENENYWVSYKDPKSGLGHVIVYSKDGSVIRQENELEPGAYPNEVKEYISKKHPGEKYSIWESENEKGEKSFYIPRKKEYLWFDSNGKYRKSKR